MPFVRTYIKAPRLAGVPSFLKELAFEMEVELEITDREKGWWFETIFFRVEGPLFRLNEFKYVLGKSIEQYQER